MRRQADGKSTREPWDFGRFVQTAVFFVNPLTMAQRIAGKVASTIRPPNMPEVRIHSVLMPERPSGVTASVNES